MVKKEIIAEGRTVEAAVSAGAAELGSTPERVTYEIIETPKRGFLGFGETPAKVRVIFQIGPEDVALSFIRNVIDNMGINAEAEISRSLSGSGDRQINIFGSDAGLLIGHHGDTLDSLQFLVNLAVNKGDDDESSEGYTRIVVDIENYRAKREETLRSLARSMSARVKKYRKNITLEPMNPYERRIIHSEIQNIPGVSTISVGQDSSRRVVIYYEESGRSSQQQAQQAAAEALKSGDGLRREDDYEKPQRSAEKGEGRRRNRQNRQNAAAGESYDDEVEDGASARQLDPDSEDALTVLKSQKGRKRYAKKPTPAALSNNAGEDSDMTADTYEKRSYQRNDRRGAGSSGSRPPRKNKTEDLIAQTIASFRTEAPAAVPEPEKPEFKTQAVVDDSPIISNANAGNAE